MLSMIRENYSRISDDITVLNMLYIIYIMYNIHMSLTRNQKQL